MPVRVRARIKSLKGLKVGEAIVASSLLNTGYIGSSAEIIVPQRMAEALGLWPPPRDAVESTYDTAGGPAKFYAIREGAMVQVVEEDASSKELVADAVISPMEREVLLSDFVIGELGIIILNARLGYWRFELDPHDKVRRGYGPELW